MSQTGNKKKICLNMIVKDEAHIILETLNNIKKYIDYWVISDTGSTDGTQELIKNFFKEAGIDGELVSHKWRDFGYNRSKALEACYNKSDYIWVIDADDIVVGDFKFPEKMEDDLYSLKYGLDFTYDRGQVFKNRELKWEYRGILHEFPVCSNKKDVKQGKIEGNYYIDSRRLGARNKVSDKYERDAKLLSDHIMKHPNDPLTERYCFYAGQSYFDCHDYENSMKYYEKRLEFKGWYEEMYFTYNKIAHCLVRLKRSEKEIVKAFLKAHTYLPSRVEPLFDLSEYYLSINNYERACYYLSKAIRIPYPSNQILFLHRDIYEWRAKYVYIIALSKFGKYKEAYDLADKYHSLYVKEWPRFEALKMSLVNNIENEYINYDKNRVDIISKYLQTNKKNNVTFTVTTCKRFDLFEKTMNSFINCCADVLNIDRWLVVDDNSSPDDRNKMKELYPFCEFILKTPEQKGHAVSMNMIRSLVTSPYILHMEDDWKFFVKKNYIKPAIEILIRNEINPMDEIPSDQDIKNKKIAQVLFNKNYTIVPDRPVLGGYLAKTNNNIVYRIHEHYPAGSDVYNKTIAKYKGGTCIYWPHYSLQPSVMSTAIYKDLGPYPSEGFFERKYADIYYSKNYISVFYDSFSCIHIGKQPWDKSNNNQNAYELNNVSQFNLNNPNIANNLKQNNSSFDDYDFYPNKDSMGDDISYVANKTIEELKILADTDENCLGFNTYGYLKFNIKNESSFINLQNRYYNNDGLYVKKINNSTSISTQPLINTITINQTDDNDYLESYKDDDFVIYKGLDIIGKDICLNLSIIEDMKIEALNNDKCIGFNTYGYFKNELGPLVHPKIFSKNDGIFIKKKYQKEINDIITGCKSVEPIIKNKDPLKKIIIIVPIRIKSIATYMDKILTNLNYTVDIKYSLNKYDPLSDDLYIIIGYPSNIDLLPKTYILYQIENPDSNWFNDEYTNMIKNSKYIWEYSTKNKLKYEHLNNKINYMPMPFCISQSNDIFPSDIKYDILFYGTCNDRRNNILSLLSEKYNIKIAYDVFESDRDQLINESKIIINLHYYDNTGLETCRINEILQYNKLVISEKPSNGENDNKLLYDNIVVFCDVINDDLSNIEQLYQLIDFYIDDVNYSKQIDLIKSNIPTLCDTLKTIVKNNMDIFNNVQS